MSKDSQKPQNLRANVMPTDGYVLSVDGKLKTSYETAEEATAAGAQLKRSFPVIQITVYDAARKAYVPVNLPEE
jgi:hypothetical protein